MVWIVSAGCRVRHGEQEVRDWGFAKPGWRSDGMTGKLLASGRKETVCR